MIQYYVIFNKEGKQSNLTKEPKKHQDLGNWVKVPKNFNIEKDIAVLENGDVKILRNKRIEELDIKKYRKEKLIHLLNKFNESKQIHICNGNTIIIKPDTPERKYFKRNLELSLEIKTDPKAILSYWQKVGTKILGFNVNV